MEALHVHTSTNFSEPWENVCLSLSLYIYILAIHVSQNKLGGSS